MLKTSILAELTVRSSLGDIYIKDDDSCMLNMLIIYCLMFYIIYVTLIMRLWDLYNLVAILVEFDMDSLLLFSSYIKLIPEVWSYFRCLLLKVISDLLCTLYNLCIIL